jgi:hypothetical protein
MRSEQRGSFPADRAGHHSAEPAPRQDAAAAEVFDRAIPPVNTSNRVSQPWIQAAEAVVDWYGAMFRLAFGLGRLSSGHDVPGVVTSPPPPPPRAEEESPPAAALDSMANAPLKLRPKRRKSPSTANRRSRLSSVKRSRRAA